MMILKCFAINQRLTTLAYFGIAVHVFSAVTDMNWLPPFTGRPACFVVNF